MRTNDFQDKNNNGTDDRDEGRSRMAGDALKDANFEARQRLSNDPEKAAERAGLVGDKYDVSGYSDKEISMALQGASFGDKDYARLTGKGSGEEDPTPGTPAPDPIREPGDPVVTIPTPVPGPGPGKPTPFPTIPGPGEGLFGGQQQIVNQDNDINTNVTGDNNTVNNSQDNSIRQSMGSSDYATRYARGLKDKYVLNLLNR